MADITAKATLVDGMSPVLKKMGKNTKAFGDDAVKAFREFQKANGETSSRVVKANNAISASIKKLNSDYNTWKRQQDSLNRSLAELDDVSSRASSGGVSALRSGLGSLGAMVGVGGLAKAFFDANTQVENLEVKFNTLLGGAEQAKARVKELRDFSARTPFQLEEVANASRVLETLTKGALSTGDALRMVGDAAAMSGDQFDNLAMWVGRAYDGLQSNRPIGEAMMRLQELGLVSGDARNKIEELTKQARGKEGWTILKAELERARGGMEQLSQTTTGQISTMKDLAKQMMVNLGGTGFLKTAISRMNTFLQTTNETLEAQQALNEAMNREKFGQLRMAIALIQKINVEESLGAKVQVSTLKKRELAYDRVLDLSKKLGLSEKEIGKMVQESRIKQIEKTQKITWLTEEQRDLLNEMDFKSQQELDRLNSKIEKTKTLNSVKKDAEKINVTKQKKVKASDLMEGFDEGYGDTLVKRSEEWQEMLDKNLQAKLEANEKQRTEDEAQAERLQKQADLETAIRQKAQDDDTKIREKGAQDRIRLAEMEYNASMNLALTLNSSLSTIARNALGTSKKNAKLRKGIAYGEAMINTALGVSKALASGSPPINFINAAAVGAAGAAQVSTIASQKFATGGIVKGNGGSDLGDKQMIRVNAGEGVFTKEQMKALGKTEINMPITINGNADQGVVNQFSEIAQSIIGAIRNGDLDLINELNLQTA